MGPVTIPAQCQGELKSDDAYAQVLGYANNDHSITSYTQDEGFRLWLKILDMRVLRRLGVSLFDLRDFTLRDWYDDGITPKQALGLIREEGL